MTKSSEGKGIKEITPKEIDDVYKKMIDCKYYETRSLKVERIVYQLNKL